MGAIHDPDVFHRRQAEPMAGYGIPETDIARVLGIDPKTLRKHYRDELETGHILANAKVARASSARRQATTGRPSRRRSSGRRGRAGMRPRCTRSTAQGRTETMSDAARETAAAEFTRKIEALAKRRLADPSVHE